MSEIAPTPQQVDPPLVTPLYIKTNIKTYKLGMRIIKNNVRETTKVT